MKILAGNSNKALAKHLALELNADYIESLTIHFNDTEIKVEILQSVYNEDVVIVQSTSRPANDHLIELLLLIDVAKKSYAKQIIVVMPYFGYSRQDRKFSNNTAMPAQLIANLLKTTGATSIITVDLHSPEIENFFEIPIQNLSPLGLYLPFLKNYNDFTIVAPDKGSIERAQKINNVFNIDIATINKQRDINNICEMIAITGNVKGKNCILIDDIIDSGETICKAAKFLMDNSALAVDAFVTHAVLSAGSLENIKNSAIRNVYITDTIHSSDLKNIAGIHVITIASIIIQALQPYVIASEGRPCCMDRISDVIPTKTEI
ncbi:ribose-phosphate diphosphokinase [Rickettsia endosymbiont of Halotydeus destructor]|uniref:ribose-phosphate diphosphokinase n=1 Tax=Rickettsia endosymbiont of Halotydeus destructor TaxID=2996754 RepID=UPI003BB06C78